MAEARPEKIPGENNLTRAEMRRELAEIGTLGMVYHVGSDPTKDVQEAFKDIVLREAVTSGYTSWLQGKDPLEAMEVQPLYHPEIGLEYDPERELVYLNEEKLDAYAQAMEDPNGIDFHPDAAKGWYELLRNADQLQPWTKVLKTHIASLGCSRRVLDQGLLGEQKTIYKALARGHLRKAKEIARLVIASIDDPVFSLEGAKETAETFAGTETLLALHSCGNVEVLQAIKSGMFDIVHYDAWKQGEGGIPVGISPLIGQSEDLHNYLATGGLLALGGVPQNLETLEQLAKHLNAPQEVFDSIKQRGNYQGLTTFLYRNAFWAGEYMTELYKEWIRSIAKESGLDEKQVARQVFVSATCGYGTNPKKDLRTFSYSLAREVAQAIADWARN
jgi:hypothetical protein